MTTNLPSMQNGTRNSSVEILEDSLDRTSVSIAGVQKLFATNVTSSVIYQKKLQLVSSQFCPFGFCDSVCDLNQNYISELIKNHKIRYVGCGSVNVPLRPVVSWLMISSNVDNVWSRIYIQFLDLLILHYSSGHLSMFPCQTLSLLSNSDESGLLFLRNN